MTVNEYQVYALKTKSDSSKRYPRILNGLMGLSSEAGEAIGLLKKHMFQGQALDKDRMAKERMAKKLGDIVWYLAISADAIGYDLESILWMNVEKLQKRHPDGFDSEFSQHRKMGDV